MIHLHKYHILVALLFLLILLILLFQISKPFFGHHDFNNAFYGNMARNLIRYSLVDTKLAQVTNSGTVATVNFTFHTHHPPLLIWSLGISYLILGISEFSTRVVPLIFSLATLVSFYQLVKIIFNRRTAIAAVAFWAVTPLFFYFGKMAIQEILVVFFVISTLWQYELWNRTKSKLHRNLIYINLTFACLSGWPGYYLLPLLWFWEFLKFKTIRKEILFLISVPLVAFSTHLLQNLLTTKSIVGGGFWEAFLLRKNDVPILFYLKREISWSLAYFTKPLVILAVVGGIVSVLKKNIFLPILLLFGLMHLLLFKQAVYRHDYLIYYLLPFTSLGAAYLINKIFRQNVIFGFVSLVLIFTMVASSLLFTSALLTSNYGRQGVKVGTRISKKIKPDGNVLVISKNIFNNFEWQVVFYADRQLRIVPVADSKLEGFDDTIKVE